MTHHSGWVVISFVLIVIVDHINSFLSAAISSLTVHIHIEEMIQASEFESVWECFFPPLYSTFWAPEAEVRLTGA